MLNTFKSIRNLLIGMSFFLLLATQCHAERTYFIIWGYVCNMDSPCPGVNVVLTDVRSSRASETTSDSDGIYMFWLPQSSGGNYNVSIAGAKIIGYSSGSGTASSLGATVIVTKGMASRLDIDYNEKFMAKNRTEQSTNYICYVTKTGGCYHAYGCKYLYESCIPLPYGYALWKGYKPCSECLK
jgi:hypothetical protein